MIFISFKYWKKGTMFSGVVVFSYLPSMGQHKQFNYSATIVTSSISKVHCNKSLEHCRQVKNTFVSMVTYTSELDKSILEITLGKLLKKCLLCFVSVYQVKDKWTIQAWETFFKKRI